MKTLAAVLVEQKKPLELMELEIPALKQGQVLVEIHYAGLCHAQLHEWKGTKGVDPYLPHTLGHEGAGVVLEIGEGVQKVNPGDRVVLTWIKGSGLDGLGAKYCVNRTIVNSGPISTFLQTAVISENRLVPISSDVPLREAALLGCAVPTGAGVILNEMKVQPNESIAIFGVGGIGLSALIAAKAAQAYPIFAVDVSEDKLQKAKELGATHCVNATLQSPVATIQEALGGKGVDYAFESAGKRQVMEMAFESIRPFGGLCVLAGNLPKEEKIHLDPFELIKGKRVLGTWGGSSQVDRDVPYFAKLFVTDQNILGPLVSHEVGLEGLNELMEQLDQGRLARGLIAFKQK